ncbi:hypothetical protein L210DRAFT_3415490, partial [Boletus edulis BED1]
GPGLPRRDCEESLARHARLMLILFKPWHSVMDLRGDCTNWVDAYNLWVEDAEGMFPLKRRLIDNIHAVQECKDARDRDLSHH